MNNKPKTYFFVTSKGVDYLQTYNSYLAKALAFVGHHYLTFDTEDGKLYSFKESDKLTNDLMTIVNIRKENKNE